MPVDINQYTIRTPGSMVADTLQEILVRRKLEARQAMLDQLARQDKEHQWKHDDTADALAQKQDERAGTLQNFNINRLGASDVPGGASEEGLNPDVLKYMIEHGMLGEQPGKTPFVSGKINSYGDSSQSGATAPEPTQDGTFDSAAGVVGNPEQGRRVAIGNEKYREQQQKNTDLDKFIADPSVTGDKDRLFAAMAVRAGAIPSMPDSVVGPAPSMTVVSPNFRGTQQIARGGQGHVAPYAPQPTAAASSSLYQLPDPANPGQFKSHWLKPGEQPSAMNEIQGGTARKGNIPNEQNQDIFPPNLAVGYSNLPARAGIGSDARERASRQYEDTMLGQSRATDVLAINFVKDTLNEVRARHDAGRPIPSPDVILTNAEKSIVGITPQDKSDINKMLTVLLSRYYAR